MLKGQGCGGGECVGESGEGGAVCADPQIDARRCCEAGILAYVGFATKLDQAVELLAEAAGGKVPFAWPQRTVATAITRRSVTGWPATACSTW